MTLYSTGMCRSEACQLQVSDIDSGRNVIHIRGGKRRRDRDVPLSAKLLETLREYWRWMKPKTWLFPGYEKGWRVDTPITDKVIWHACKEAAKNAGIQKRVTPHLLRHYATFRTMLPWWLMSGRGQSQTDLCRTVWSLSRGIVREGSVRAS
jgi:integrase